MTVLEAVESEVAELARRAPAVGVSSVAALVRAMAAEVDDPGNSATSKSMCAKVMLDGLERLHRLVPEEQESDRLDELAARRVERIRAAGV